MATHSNILAWRIPWTEEPGGLWSIGLQSWTQMSDFTCMHIHHLRSVMPCAGPLANRNSFQPYNGLGVMIITKLQMRENWAWTG